MPTIQVAPFHSPTIIYSYSSMYFQLPQQPNYNPTRLTTQTNNHITTQASRVSLPSPPMSHPHSVSINMLLLSLSISNSQFSIHVHSTAFSLSITASNHTARPPASPNKHNRTGTAPGWPLQLLPQAILHQVKGSYHMHNPSFLPNYVAQVNQCTTCTNVIYCRGVAQGSQLSFMLRLIFVLRLNLQVGRCVCKRTLIVVARSPTEMVLIISDSNLGECVHQYYF